MSTRRRLEASLDRSQLRTTLKDAADTSTAVGVGRRIRTLVGDTYRDSGGWDRWTRTSVAITIARSTRETLEIAAGTAAITRVGSIIPYSSWARESFLYRWLTKEPDPEVIVIDLRETVTVGPIIALLDHGIEAFTPSIRRSTLVGSFTAMARATRAAPVRVLSLVALVAAIVNLLMTLVLAGFDPADVALSILVIGVATVGTRVTMSWDELHHTRAGRLIAAVLKPPEPVEDDVDDDHSERD